MSIKPVIDWEHDHTDLTAGHGDWGFHIRPLVSDRFEWELWAYKGGVPVLHIGAHSRRAAVHLAEAAAHMLSAFTAEEILELHAENTLPTP